MEPAWQARYNPRADHVEEVWQGHLDLASRWKMNDVVSSLDKYAAGQIDVTDLQRLLAHQLASAPDTAPSILAAIAAAERAGKIRTNDSRALGDWVRSTTLAPKNPSTSVGQPPGDPTVMRAPTQPEASAPPTAPKAPTPAPASPGQDRTEAVREGAVLKNRYLLEKRIGAGGMGVVFRARDLEQQRIGGEEHYVAIKVLQPEFREHPDALRSLYEEVRKTRELAHPNIVGVYDCQQDGEHVFMTMQYLEGKTLEVLLDDDFARGMPWERARPIIEGMGSALAYAHDRGVIHCDFKPSNVFITVAGVAKVLDFGIARAARGGQRRFDPGALGALTPAYASAEMIRFWRQEAGQGDAAASDRPDPRDDIFALACVVFELLTGQHPFDRRDAEQARREHLVCPRVPGLSVRQNAAIAKAMAFDRDRRSARVEEFMRDLLSAPPARRPWPWAVATLAAAAVASVAIWGWWQDRSPAQRAQPAPTPPAAANVASAAPPAASPSPVAAAPSAPAAQPAPASAPPAAASPAIAVTGSGVADQKRAAEADAGREREQVAAVMPVALNRPQGVAFYDDRLYVANGGGNQVLVYAEQLDGSSDVTGLKHVATITSPDLKNPARLTFDSSGHLYVASRDNNAVSVYDVRKGNREITASAGGALISGGSLRHPLGVAVDSSGNVYVANNQANSISIFRPNTPGDVAAGFTEARFSPLSADASGNSFSAPGVIADEMIGGKEYLLVGLGAENASDAVLLYAAPLTARSAPAYVLSNAICSILPSGATGIARYASTRNPLSPVLYISSFAEGKVFRYAANDFANGADSSCPTAVAGGKGMNGPQGVAVDAAGNVFVANAGSSGDNANTISVYPGNHGLAATDVRPSLVYPAASQRSAADQQMPSGRDEPRFVDTGAPVAGVGRSMVNRVEVQADPQKSLQNCPGVVTFTATVDVHGLRRPVIYRWVRSDGATSDVMSAEPGDDSTLQLTDTWRVGAAGAAGASVSGWERLDISSPPLLRANSAKFHPRAEFIVHCRPNGSGPGYGPHRPSDAPSHGGAAPRPEAPRLPFNLPQSIPGQNPR